MINFPISLMQSVIRCKIVSWKWYHETYKKWGIFERNANSGLRSRFHERNGFYHGAPSLRQFRAHTKRKPPVIQNFAGSDAFTNDDGEGHDFISSVYLKRKPTWCSSRSCRFTYIYTHPVSISRSIVYGENNMHTY